MATDFRDIFISYGVGDSIPFAEKLWERCQQEGISVWWDKKDIPAGSLWQDKFLEGVRSAHNVVFVISAASAASANCRKELETAQSLGKRIIPVTWQGIPDRDMLAQLHQAAKERQWTPFQEDFEGAFAGLMRIVRSHRDHTERHTWLLDKASQWLAGQKSEALLLTGQDREEMEKWLLNSHQVPASDAPAKVTSLLTDYVCASKKNAENLMTQAFITYATQDRALMERVRQNLHTHAITTWLHAEDIDKARDYGQQIEQGIRQADNVLFFISPHSIHSEWCLKELNIALHYHKRILPLLISPVSPDELPEAIRGLQYVDFTDNNEDRDVRRDLDDVVRTIRDSEAEYHARHKLLLVQAHKWEVKGHRDSLLLRGRQLDLAKDWLYNNEDRLHEPPTELHRRFIEESVAKHGQVQNDVFLSYSRNDSVYARRINEHLQERGLTTWFDQESIPPGAADFAVQIRDGIERSSVFLFLLSPRAVASPHCAGEVEYAAGLSRKFVTALASPVDVSTLHPELARVQWVDLSDPARFERGLEELHRAVTLDLDHAREHAKWGQEASDWEESGKDDDYLLNATAYGKAADWLKRADDQHKQPPPTALQREYLQKSQVALEEAKAKEQQVQQSLSKRLRNARIAVGFAIIALIVAVVFLFQARESEREAEANTFIVLARELAAKNPTQALRILEMALDLAPDDSRIRQSLMDIFHNGDMFYANQIRRYETVYDIAVSQDGALMSVAERYGMLTVWACTSGVVMQEPLWYKQAREMPGMIPTDSSDTEGPTFVFTAISPDAAHILATSKYQLWMFDRSGNLTDTASLATTVDIIRFSPDGQYVSIISNTGTDAWLWRLSDGQLILLSHEGNNVSSVNFSPDSKYLVTTSYDQKIRQWSLPGVQLERSFQMGGSVQYPAYTATITADYTIMAAHNRGYTVWGPDGKERHRVEFKEDVNRIEIAPSANYVMVSDATTNIQVFDQVGTPIGKIGHEASDYIIQALFTEDDHIISLSDNGKVKVSTVHGKLIGRCMANDQIRAFYQPTGEAMATVTIEQTIQRWVWKDQQLLRLEHVIPGMDAAGLGDIVSDIKFLPDGESFVTASRDGKGRLWDQAGNLIRIYQTESELSGVDIDPEGKKILLVGLNGKTYMWSVEGQLLQTFEHALTYNQVRFMPDGQSLFFKTGKVEGTSMLTDLQGNVTAVFEHDPDAVIISSALMPDGQIITGTPKHTIFWSKDGKRTQTYTQLNPNEALIELAVSPSGKWIGSIGYRQDPVVAPMDQIATANMTLPVKIKEEDMIYTLRFAPNDQYVAVILSSDKSMAVCYDTKGSFVGQYPHSANVSDLTFSPEGDLIATASGDKTAKLWYLSGGVYTTLHHPAIVNKVVYSPNGQYLVTSSTDQLVRIWRDPSVVTEWLKNAPIPPFTLDELDYLNP